MVIQKTFDIRTRGRGTTELTSEVHAIVRDAGVRMGLCHVFTLHTSASLMLCENADPDVLADLETFMSQTIPDGYPMFRHTTEGPDDMPAHIRSVLTDSSLTLPVNEGRCMLGTWQGIYLWEHRYNPHHRKIMVTVYGE